jgi:hypothetical protein
MAEKTDHAAKAADQDSEKVAERHRQPPTSLDTPARFIFLQSGIRGWSRHKHFSLPIINT